MILLKSIVIRIVSSGDFFLIILIDLWL